MNILEAQEIRSGKKGVRPFSLPPVGAAPLIAPAGPATAPAVASAPVIPSAPKQRGVVGEVIHDIGQAARAVGTGLYSAVADVLPGQVAKTIVGSDVALGEGGRAQQYAAKQAEDLKRWEMSPEDRENKLFGIVKAGTVQQGLQQMGNSIAPMVAGIGAGAAAASMVDTPVSPVADIIGGVIGAGTLTAPMAYRASKADYVLSMRDAFKQARPSGTEKEWQAFKASIEDNAKLYGLWEAGPEVVGNMVTAGLIKTPAGGIIKAIPLIESSAARLLASGVAKLALDMPVEVLTESVTGYQQAKIEYESGLRAEPPTPAGAFVEAAPQTIVMTLATMGLGSVANSLMTDNSGQVQRHKIIRLLNKSGVGKETINDLLDAKDWNGFNSSMKKHEAEIAKVGADLSEATAGTPAAEVATDPNAPAVNPILNPEAAQGPSVFDAPIGTPPAATDADTVSQPSINPLLASNQPTTNAEDAESVRKAMASRGEAFAGIRAVEPPPSVATAAVKEVSDKMGVKVIWIDGAPVGGRAIQGAAPEGSNTIFLHTDLLTNPNRDPVMMVYAHELTHRSEKASVKEFGVLKAAILARAEARASVEEKVASGMSLAAAQSEAVAESVEVLGTDQAFWSEVFAGKEQSFIEHIIQIVTDMAERVFGTNQAAKAEQIRGAAVAAFQALQAKNQAQATSQINVQGQAATINQQEAANGVQEEGQAQEVAQPLQAAATADVAITGTPEIKAPPQAAQTAKPPASEVAALRRESESAKADRALRRAEKRKAEIEYNKKFKGSGLTRKQAARARRIYDYDLGDTPVLSAVIEHFNGIRKEDAAKYEIETASLPKSIRSKLFPAKGGADWNSIIWTIENDNLIPGILRADEVGEAISKEIKLLQMRSKEEKAMAQAYRQRSEDDRGFKRAIIRDDKNAKVRREAVDLRDGDKLVRKIDGIPVEFKVTVEDDTTGDIVISSTLYGSQPVEHFEMVHADKLIRAEDAAKEGAEDVPFSTKDATEDEGESLADTASSIDDDAEREAFARAELETRANIPMVQGPKNLAVLSQNHVVATAKDLLGRMASGELDPVEAMESLEAVEKRVGRTVARAESKAAKEAKMAGESRQQGLPGMEGLAKSPYGTPDDGASGTLFSAKKIEPDNSEGTGRERAYSISRYFREELKREWTRTYKQKSAQQAIGELQAITEKQGEDWVMDHLYDFSNETLAEFPMNLRPLAGRTIIESANKAFRAWGINDDGSNMPNNPLIDKLWLKMQTIIRLAGEHERKTGQGNAWLNSTYGRNDVNSPLGVRKFINEDLHKKLSAPVIGPVKAPVIEKVIGESKTAYDEAISALEAERKANAEKDETISTLRGALSKNIVSDWETKIRRPAENNPAARRALDEKIAEKLAKLRAGGSLMSGLSTQAEISMARDAVFVYMGVHGADIDGVSSFLKRELPGQTLSEDTVMALMKDVENEMAQIVRAATKESATPRKGEAKPRKGATVITRAPDMTIQPDKQGPQRLFDSGKMWGEGRVLNIGEADAKRLALELTEAGQTVMRGISSNVEVVISNALRHGRNAAGIEKVLIDSGIDPDTARRMVKNIVKRRAELVRPALETLRQKYAAKGDKVSRTIASAMDKIMAAMDLADRASTSQVSGFFDGNAWDESRRIIEEAFGFKSEITRDWFNETMRLYREYEKADEAGNHVVASIVHSEMLHRVARVQNGDGIGLAIKSFIQGGKLWGPGTHLWNLFNTASRNIDAANASSIEQAWRAATAEKGKRLDYLKGIFAPWAIMGMSHKQAWGVSKYILKTGVNPLSMRIGDENKFGTDPRVASAPEWHPFFKKFGMRPFKYVGRALIAADSYFRTNIENTDIYIQAYNAAISRGEPAPLAAKQALGMVGFVTDGTNEAYNEAARKADEAGLKGADRDMNIRIELMNKLDTEMRDHAQKQGAVETFNDQNPEGLAGWFADALRNHSSNPIIWYLGMFARIGANVFNYGMQTNTLTGYISLALGSKFGRYKAGKGIVKLTPEEKVRRTIRATQGLAVTGTVLAMALSAAKDYDDDDDPNKKLKFGVSAIGPRDSKARKLWRQQNKPFMLTVNGKEISYKWIAPLATPLVIAGAIMDEIRFGNIKDAETDEAREESFTSALLPTMFFGIMSITTDDLPGNNMVKFGDLIYSGSEGGAQSARTWNRFFQQQAASIGTDPIPYSALVRYFDRLYDPTVYTPNTIDGLKMYPYAFLRNVPYFRKKLLYPMRNIFGDPIQVPDEGGEMGIGERAAKLTFDRFLNNMVEDQDIQFLTKVQRGFNAPSRKETRIVTNEGGLYGLRNLTDAEYDRYLEIFGGELRRQVAEVRTAYTSSAEVEKWATPQNKTLRKRLEDARSTAMNWAMYKFLTETGKQVVRSKE